jgi:hypothetical protein
MNLDQARSVSRFTIAYSFQSSRAINRLSVTKTDADRRKLIADSARPAESPTLVAATGRARYFSGVSR